VSAGQTYFIVVDGYATSQGSFSLTVTAPNPDAPTATPTPVGGACQNPTVIPAGGGTFAATTTGPSTLAGSCANTASAPEQVFAWTPAATGTAVIQTCDGNGTAYDTVLYLRQGTCAGGSEVACNDDTSGCQTSEPHPYHGSRLTPSVVAGTTYFIVVDGYATSAGPFKLTVVPPAGGPAATATVTPVPAATRTVTPVPAATATVTPPPAVTATPAPTATAGVPQPTATGPAPQPTTTPAGGTCNAPIVLPATGGTFTGTTSGTSALAGTCASTSPAPEQVFAWTPTSSGPAFFRTCGATSYDTVMYVRRGSCAGAELACNDDTTGCPTATNTYHGSQLSLDAVAGETYFIIVDGYADRRGTFSLTVVPPSP
jgi:hypothetical protein